MTSAMSTQASMVTIYSNSKLRWEKNVICLLCQPSHVLHNIVHSKQQFYFLIDCPYAYVCATYKKYI